MALTGGPPKKPRPSGFSQTAVNVRRRSRRARIGRTPRQKIEAPQPSDSDCTGCGMEDE